MRSFVCIINCLEQCIIQGFEASFTNIIINTHGYELHKYFTMVQFFEDFIEEKGFINFFVRFFFFVICYNLNLIDFSDVVPVPVCCQYIHVSST
jgi:hypothetical protein